MTTKRTSKIILLVVLAALALALIYVAVTAVNIWSFASVDEAQHADVAIVLGAAATDGQPSNVFRERINHAIELYNNGYVTALIMTGGHGEGEPQAESTVARTYAIQQGIPQASIFTEEESTITEENLVSAAGLMQEHGFTSALIVSDPLHMKRAMMLANDLNMTARSSPTQTSAYVSNRTKLPFLAREVFFYIGYQAIGSNTVREAALTLD